LEVRIPLGPNRSPTGVLNRRGFQTRVERLLAARDHVASSLVVCDLDSFKPINDRFGHVVGDEVLRDLCVLLRASARKSDVLGRIGGDEFAIYLTGSTHRDAVEFCERIRDDLSRAQFRALPGTESITASFGVGQRSREWNSSTCYALPIISCTRRKNDGGDQWRRPPGETSDEPISPAARHPTLNPLE
jgi:diguanylate cyclase (GGDEF)-like protein